MVIGMGYRKVYLTKEEEAQLQFVQDCRVENGEPRSAYNAILKEGFGMLFDQYRDRYSPHMSRADYEGQRFPMTTSRFHAPAKTAAEKGELDEEGRLKRKAVRAERRRKRRTL